MSEGALFSPEPRARVPEFASRAVACGTRCVRNRGLSTATPAVPAPAPSPQAGDSLHPEAQGAGRCLSASSSCRPRAGISAHVRLDWPADVLSAFPNWRSAEGKVLEAHSFPARSRVALPGLGVTVSAPQRLRREKEGVILERADVHSPCACDCNSKFGSESTDWLLGTARWPVGCYCHTRRDPQICGHQGPPAGPCLPWSTALCSHLHCRGDAEAGCLQAPSVFGVEF